MEAVADLSLQKYLLKDWREVLGFSSILEGYLKDNFNADNWLNHSKENFQRPSEQQLATALIQNSKSEHNTFNPKNFVLPDWKGYSLPSKDGMALLRLIELFKEDAEKQFGGARFTKSLERSVYSDFLEFAFETSADFSGINSYEDLLYQFRLKENSPFSEELENFKNELFHRVSVMFILKIRFMVLLSKTLDLSLSKINLQNPNSFFMHIFRPGSSSGIDSAALKKNRYSWFQPRCFNDLDNSELEEVMEIFHSIPLTEIYKICNINDLFSDGKKEEHCHSLSHESFGNFLIQILTLLPEWLQSQKPLKMSNVTTLLNNRSEILLKTLFTGDNLESLSLSHWLAQEKVSLKDKKYILYPDFKVKDNDQASFMNLCFELLFLGLLTEISERSNLNPVQLISNSYKKCKSKTPIQNRYEQVSLFESSKASEYDRIVLNLKKFPKKNPHHFLLNKITDTAKKLDQGGYLFVFSNQKLFLPSMAKKIEDLLSTYRLDAVFTFDGVKGRGELPPYLYVISKRSEREKKALMLPEGFIKEDSPLDITQIFGGNEKKESSNSEKKYPCLSFRVSGTLTTFSKFNIITKAFKDFVLNKDRGSTPAFQKELDQDFSFEFYKDAICNGRLIYTSTKDRTKITHPSYFKNLMRSCLPLGDFFHIENLDSGNNQKEGFTNDLLGIKYTIEESYPWILLVDYRTKGVCRLEFINSVHYQARIESHGKALCSYFGVSPKIRGLNINQFNHFFNNDIGMQTIQLGINGTYSKLKGKIESLLIPKFFSEINYIPKHLESSLRILNLNKEDLKSKDISSLYNDFEDMLPYFSSTAKKYPWHIYSLLVYFENLINDFSNELKINQKSGDIFEIPSIIEKVLKLKSSPIYPQNDDVFIKFHITNAAQLNCSLTSTKVASHQTGGKELAGISFYSQEDEILTLFSKPTMTNFIKFLSTHLEGRNISDILQYTSIPSLDDLESIVQNYQEQALKLTELKERIKTHSKSIITKQLSIF